MEAVALDLYFCGGCHPALHSSAGLCPGHCSSKEWQVQNPNPSLSSDDEMPEFCLIAPCLEEWRPWGGTLGGEAGVLQTQLPVPRWHLREHLKDS